MNTTAATCSVHSRASGNPAAKDRAPASAGSSGEEKPFAADLAEIRQLADLLPGAKPVAVNGIRVAASIRPERFVIEGGGDRPVTMPRTAFQVVYADGTVMIDAGLDRETHDSFSTPDQREPYYPEEFAKLQRALNDARVIVLTHFHADHVAGVTQAANADELAARTVATRHTLDLMVNRPHRPHLKLSPERAARFRAVDYDWYHALAPGLVLIKAAGHAPDHQMVYIALADGHEILHSVDVAWNFENIRQIKGKAAPWVKEDVPAVMGQLRWLNDITLNEPSITLLVTHDDELFARNVTAGAIGATLAT
jgi:glyoxylase-like metal-dependent hydrolase (beta-lactamase superfamily II)